jgi:hypothetical protein
MITPAGFRHSFGLAGSVAGFGSTLGCVSLPEALCAIIVGVFIGYSIFETDKPYGHCEQDCHAKINQSRQTQMAVELQANQNLPSDDGKHEPDNDAAHPCGKIGAQNVEGW